MTTVVFQWLRQPVVLGYVLAGLLVGPHVPFPLVADSTVVQTLSQLGVILVMFSLGLEFSLRKLARVGPAAGLTAVVETSLMMWLGVLIGRWSGWASLESLFAGAIIAISSTTIIAKAFEEQRVGGRLRDFVVGVLVVEDLIAILLVATLTVASSGAEVSAGPVAMMAGRLAVFLVGLLVVGLLLVPRTVRAITRLQRRETTLVASIGLCFAAALLARTFGYTVALGAFIAGSLVAESGEQQQVAPLIEPVRDMFAAIFFVSVGMLIDPVVIARHWPAVAVLTGAVLAGKVLGVSLGAFLTGTGLHTALRAGMSMAQIGEFSFIIAGVALTRRAGEFLYPVAVAVSALTTLSTPWLIRLSGPAAAWIDRRLPRPLQTFAALYGSWIEQLRAASRAGTAATRIRRLVRMLVFDAAVLAVIIVGTSTLMDRVVARARSMGLGAPVAHALVLGAALALSSPFALGVVRVGRRLGVVLARVALPRMGRRVDLAGAPRRMLVVTLQLASILLVAAPLLALTQPFLPWLEGVAALAVVFTVLGVAFWRSAADLQGHIRAGAQVIVEALVAHAARGESRSASASLEQVRSLLPGIGPLVAVRLEPESPAIGRTLAELNLRGLTGATVLAITRKEGEGITVPAASERLRSGDVLALAGTAEAIDAAVRVVAGRSSGR